MAHYVTVENYRLYIFSHDGNPDTRRIQCFDANGRMVARIWFLPDGQRLSDNQLFEERNPIFIEYKLHEKDYQDVVDLLRNEKPIIILYGGPRHGWIGTSSDEPVGQEETE